MPINTDAIQMMLNAWDQGVQQSRARRIESEVNEQRKIENKQRDADLQERIRTNSLSNELATQTFNLNKLIQEATLREKSFKGVAEEEIAPPPDASPEVLAQFAPELENIQPGFGLMANEIARPQTYAPLGLDIPSHLFPKPGHSTKAKQKERELTIREKGLDDKFDLGVQRMANELAKIDLRSEYGMKMLDEKIKSLEKIAGGRDQTAIAVALIGALSRQNVATMRGGGVGNSGLSKPQIAERDKWFQFTGKIDLPEQINSMNLAGKAFAAPGKLNSAEQFSLAYGFIKASDPKTGVKDAEFTAVRNLLVTYFKAKGIAIDNITEDDARLLHPDTIKQIADLMQRKQDVVKKNILQHYNSYKAAAGMTDEQNEVHFAHPFGGNEGYTQTPSGNTGSGLPSGVFGIKEKGK